MPHREFSDPQGTRWQAWEVIPSTAERRASGERRFGVRDSRDRRTQRQFRVELDEGMAQGWLVFESDTEKRRLYPIPEHWDSRTDDELTALCASADAAPRSASAPLS